MTPISPARAGFSWTPSVDNVSQVRYTLYANGIPQVSLFDSTHYTHFDLTPSTTYEFQVIASDVFGNAVEGNTASMTMPSTTDTVPPTAPTNLTGAAMDNEVHMNWGLSTDNADPQSVILYEFCSRSTRDLPAGEVGRDPIGVERQDAHFRWRPSYEAADEQQILRLLRCQRLFQTSAGGRAERQPGSDLEARARAGG